MQQIINFLIRNKNFILYLFLFSVAIGLTIQSHSYHRSKFIKSANWISGGVYTSFSNLENYFGLKTQNKILSEENKRLRELLISQDDTVLKELTLDSVSPLNQYRITHGNVIKNSFSRSKNYITINKGSKDGISQDMGVISSRGIVGIVESTSKNFSVVQSILNDLSLINAKLKKTNHFGSLTWDTKDYRIVQLIDIPRLVPLKVGDTIITGGASLIFPEGIPIGTIKNYQLNKANSLYTINVSLFNDMTNINHVYLIKNRLKKEVDSLQNLIPNE